MHKAEKILSYLIGGIASLVTAIFFLLLLHGGGNTTSFLQFWLMDENFSRFVAVVSGFFTAGILIVWMTDLYNKEKARIAERKLHDETILMITHQMRTGLTVAGWGVQMFLSEHEALLGEKDRLELSGIDNTIHNTAILTESMFELVRLTTGKLTISLQHSNLGTLEKGFLDSIYRFRFGAKQKGVTLHSTITLDKAVKLVCDPSRLYLVLDNLLENAISYSGVGKKEVTVTMTNDAHFLSIQVTDTGIGIPAAEQNFIFTKFYRASNAMRESSVGTGIGLYLCREYVLGHGGTITLDSKEGIGTTFTILIPLNKAVQVETSLRGI